MAATVQLDESNGATEVVSAGVTQVHRLSADVAQGDPEAYPLAPGQNSYEKWERFRVVDLGGSPSVKNLRVYTDPPLSGVSDFYNGNTDQGSYDTTKRTTFAQPVATSTRTPNVMPTSPPATANIGKGGSLAGVFTAPGYSDYILRQLRTTVDANSGHDMLLHVDYDELA